MQEWQGDGLNRNHNCIEVIWSQLSVPIIRHSHTARHCHVRSQCCLKRNGHPRVCPITYCAPQHPNIWQVLRLVLLMAVAQPSAMCCLTAEQCAQGILAVESGMTRLTHCLKYLPDAQRLGKWAVAQGAAFCKCYLDTGRGIITGGYQGTECCLPHRWGRQCMDQGRLEPVHVFATHHAICEDTVWCGHCLRDGTPQTGDTLQ